MEESVLLGTTCKPLVDSIRHFIRNQMCPKICSHKSVEFFDLYSLYSFYTFMTIVTYSSKYV